MTNCEGPCVPYPGEILSISLLFSILSLLVSLWSLEVSSSSLVCFRRHVVPFVCPIHSSRMTPPTPNQLFLFRPCLPFCCVILPFSLQLFVIRFCLSLLRDHPLFKIASFAPVIR